MGQQQLLLLVLGIVIVGLAVVVGIQAFSENQKQSNADMMVNDAIRAQAEKDGMLSLANSARVLVNMGETTAEEMMRMTSN